LLGIVIDNARNSAAAGNAPATLALKVTDELRASLNSSGLGEASSFAPIEVADGDYEVKLLPSARFNRRQEFKCGGRPHGGLAMWFPRVPVIPKVAPPPRLLL